MLKGLKKWTSVVAMSSMILSTVPAYVLAANAPITNEQQAEQLKKIKEEIITRGAVLQTYNVATPAGNTKVFVTRINLQDPYIKIDTIYGQNNQLGNKQSIEKMAKENKAIAGINGDFFVMTGEGSPLGPMVKDGNLITTPSEIEGMYALGLTKDKQPILDLFTFDGKITTENGSSYPVSSINKTMYYINGGTNLADQINIYDSKWNLNKWVGDQMKNYYVVVVENGKVKEVLDSTKPQVIPANGYAMLAHGKAAQFLKDNLQVGQKVGLDMDIKPTADLQTLIGGHTLLVKDSKRADYTRDVSSIAGRNARTAVGYSKDKTTLYWVSAEYGKDSKGLTLEETADFMIKLGIDQGVNLDGGGSTTLVSRHLGDTEASLINQPKDNWQRAVPNGLALFSTAPVGKVKDVFINLPAILLKNETATASLKAIDEYYNPVAITDQNLKWTIPSILEKNGDILKGVNGGQGTIKLQSDLMNKEFPIEVVGKEQIKQLSLGVDKLQLASNQQAPLSPTVVTKNGKSRQVPANLLKWEMIGINGNVDAEGKVTAGEANGTGWLVGTYDQFSTMVPVQIGTIDEIIQDFEPQEVEQQPDSSQQPASQQELQFVGLPQETTGSFTNTEVDKQSGKFSAELSYDFTNATGDKQIAYGQFGDNGINFAKQAKGLSAWVKGDNSNHWLRAEIVDKNGQINYITLADRVNWTDWKQVKVDFPETIEAPTLKRIYLVNSPSGEPTQPLAGSILVDNISYQTWADITQPKDKILKLAVGKKQMQVNDETVTIDQGPIVLDSRSYIPARFVAEGLGGKVYWDAQTKKVRILMGDKMIDLWIGDKDGTIVNGINQPSDVAPIIKQNRTLIPIRMVSQNLGYQVDWNKGEITIH